MKHPWQMGLLAVAITGVSAYDIVFIKQYLDKDTPPIVMESSWEDAGLEMTNFEFMSETPSLEEPDMYASLESPPVLSLEELQFQARKAFIPGDFSEKDDKGAWPSRDPFTNVPTHAFREKKTTGISVPEEVQKETVPLMAPVPQCTFSGTLIESNRRLALIDGTPRSTGEWLNGWQIALIERDYIILEAGERSHRIELNRISSQP